MSGMENDKPLPIPEAMIATLREHYKRYRLSLVECPFKPGDLVTPRKGLNINNEGQPNIVLETRRNPEPFFSEPCSVANGRRNDIRVIGMSSRDHCAVFWVESFEYEPYTGPTD